MNLQDLFYHGIREQVRRVLSGMSDDEIDRGIDAFETGQSNWSHCFFARALPGLGLDHGRAEEKLMMHFGFRNPIPIRLVYCTFDGASKNITRDELRDFISTVRDERRPTEVLNLIRHTDYTGAAEREVVACPSSTSRE